ncbi:Inhibitor of nuclear factor kappa-B kinase subunit alpha [Dissostichus eleginoides]|uniref:Inhibitor of nuclear factor kappa-B kinase subunit alpha n=1 Tax=Dissostichus eleginoides TaxID=100907 RepID=A0AAD9B925_DISEL|nr:Inhibitor of nuclear factor kappa-B kinase subunit alpha [Dissostichus eleginoides]
MPSDIPAVPTTMRIHQVVTLSPGKIRYRDVSCMCSSNGNLECDCQKTKSFTFNATDDPTEDPNHITPEVVQWQSPEVVGKWCALVYDHIIYPGIIQEVNETHCQDVLTLIPPPENVTSRHMAIAREVWDTLASHEK